jgi:hypothetical protein
MSNRRGTPTLGNLGEEQDDVVVEVPTVEPQTQDQPLTEDTPEEVPAND